jgi:hypothetical protein
MPDNMTLPAFGATLAADEIAGVKHQRVKMQHGADGTATDVSAADPMPVTMAAAPLPSGAATQATLADALAELQAILAKLAATPALDRTTAAAPSAVRISDGTAFVAPMLQATQEDIRDQLVDIASTNQSAVDSASQLGQVFNQAGVIAINTVLLTVDLFRHQSVAIQCRSMGTTGAVTPEWSNDGTVWTTATIWTAVGATATTFNAAGMWVLPRHGRYLRLRLSTATTAGTTTIDAVACPTPFVPWYATQTVQGTVNANATAVASNVRMGYVGFAGIWYDDSSTALGAAATFTGTSRDLTTVATATAFNTATAYPHELRVSAESDVTGTLWLEVSRDNTNWRRVKSVATTAVTGGGFYAEIIHQPSWRYARVGYTNGAGAQARFTIGTILNAG